MLIQFHHLNVQRESVHRETHSLISYIHMDIFCLFYTVIQKPMQKKKNTLSVNVLTYLARKY